MTKKRRNRAVGIVRMNNLFKIAIVVLTLVSCGREKEGKTEQISVQKFVDKPVEEVASKPDSVMGRKLIEPLDPLEDESKLKLVDKYLIDVSGIGPTVIKLFTIEGWSGPGDFLKIEISNKKYSVSYSNVNGWVRFDHNYPVPERIQKINELQSHKLLLVTGDDLALLVLFGWVYASDPGLCTIINLVDGEIVLNTNAELMSIKEDNCTFSVRMRNTIRCFGTVHLPSTKYQLNIATKDETDLQKRYIATLLDKNLKDTIEVVNCVRRDLPAPNFYWDRDSSNLIFEACSDSFHESRIKIFDLKTKKVTFELKGLIGYPDINLQQFDAERNVLIYFDTSVIKNGKIPALYALYVDTRERKKLLEFESRMDMEFPEIVRDGKGTIEIRYDDNISGEKVVKRVNY